MPVIQGQSLPLRDVYGCRFAVRVCSSFSKSSSNGSDILSNLDLLRKIRKKLIKHESTPLFFFKVQCKPVPNVASEAGTASSSFRLRVKLKVKRSVCGRLTHRRRATFQRGSRWTSPELGRCSAAMSGRVNPQPAGAAACRRPLGDTPSAPAHRLFSPAGRQSKSTLI